jgi:cell division protein FtsW (lipid II flippase)
MKHVLRVNAWARLVYYTITVGLCDWQATVLLLHRDFGLGLLVLAIGIGVAYLAGRQWADLRDGVD